MLHAGVCFVQVRVLHLEAVADPAGQNQSFPPDYYQPRRSGPAPAQPAPPAADVSVQAPAPSPEQQPGQQIMFADSIESLMRNVIQKQKIDMANEVIDAGSFDNLTNDAERRQKLEAMLLVRALLGQPGGMLCTRTCWAQPCALGRSLCHCPPCCNQPQW